MILNSRVIGSKGKKVIILHGFLGSLDNWITFGKKLSNNNHQVHLIDQRNHGKSFHSDNFDYQNMAEDINEYLKQEHIDKVSIIGHSMGGKTAMSFALKYPKKIEKLIVVDILPVAYNKDYNKIFNALLEIDLKKIESRNDFNTYLERYFNDKDFILFLSKNLQRNKNGEFNYKSNIKILFEKYKNITCGIEFKKQYKNDVLFIKGEKSDYIDYEKLKLSEKFFPKYKLVEIKNAGHWLHHENPIDFISTCIDSLSS